MINTSFPCEAVMAGLLVHWQPKWKPYLALVTDPVRPWFPKAFGMLGSGTSTTRCSQIAREIAADKQETERRLRAKGIATPEGRLFEIDDVASAMSYARSLKGPVAVKPVYGGGGAGVTADIVRRSDFFQAIETLKEEGLAKNGFLVQRHLAGAHYRITVSKKRILGVLKLVPAHVVGDGRSSVVSLIEEKNRQRAARWVKSPAPIRLDADAKRLLSSNGLDPSSTPSAGQVIQLSSIASRPRGGDTVELGADLHPSLMDLSKSVLDAIPGADIAGIDIALSKGHAVPVGDQDARVIEVNVGAAVDNHLAPSEGTPVNIFRMILEDLSEDAGIPILPVGQELPAVGVRIGYADYGIEPVLDELSHLPEIEFRAPDIGSGDTIILKAAQPALFRAFEVIGRYAGTVTALSTAACGETGYESLDCLLHPTSLMPNDHNDCLLKCAAMQAPAP